MALNQPNFTKRGCENSLDIVVIPVVLVFQEFLLVSLQRLNFLSKKTF